MKYIAHKRFKGKAYCGYVNIPATTVLESTDGVIFCEGRPICFETSENAHQFFARDDDGNGMQRGRLTQAIQKRLAKRDKRHQERWDKVWDDPICQSYKRVEFDDYWLWNHNFFGAPIEDLQHIANLIGAKEET